MQKVYFSYNQIHNTIKRLSQTLKEGKHLPDVIVAIGTGGFIPARIMKTFIDRPILTVGISYYDLNNVPTESPQKIQWIDQIEQKITGKRVLLIDEVDDSRVTLEYCLRELLRHDPAEIGVMVLHNKKKTKRGAIPEEVAYYYAGIDTEDHWIVYPWDAIDIENHTSMAEKSPKKS
jgi:hypoxanthine phosphoribosyltransferase